MRSGRFVLLLVALGCAGPPLAPAPPDVAAAEVQLSLLVVGDTGKLPAVSRHFHRARTVGRAMAAEDERLPADALVLLGDNFYWDGLRRHTLRKQLRHGLVGPFCHFVDLSAPRSDEVSDTCAEVPADRHPIPIYAVLGNHDHNDPESPVLERYEVPRYVANWHAGRRLAELVELPGGVSLILLDSMLMRGGADLGPLRDALARSRGPWRILAAHHPVASLTRRSRGADLQLQELLRASGVPLQLLVAGHEHNLQAVELDMPPPGLQVIAGSGSRLREIEVVPPGAGQVGTAGVYFGRSEPGFARVDLVAAGGQERLVVSLFEVQPGPLGGGSKSQLIGRWSLDREGHVHDRYEAY